MTLETVLDYLRSNFKSLLPKLLIVIFLLMNALFVMLSFLPEWNANQDTSQQLEQSKETAAAKIAREEESSPIQGLQNQIDAAQTRLVTAAANFLTEEQADSFLNSLYTNANTSGVQITGLRSQEPTPPPASAAAYDIRVITLQVSGSAPRLVDFVARTRESAVPAVTISNLNIAESTPESLLTMDILLYTSPYASGSAFLPLTQLPDALALLPSPTLPLATAITPSPTATVTDAVVSTSELSPVALAESATPTETLESVITPTVALETVGPGEYDNTESALRYTKGEWVQISSQNGYGGSYHYSASLDAELQFSFFGSNVVVQYVAFRNFGIFEIYLDGVRWGEVDGYALEGTFGRVVNISGLPQDVHTLTIRNTGRRNEASEGTVIAIDVIFVLSPTTAPR